MVKNEVKIHVRYLPRASKKKRRIEGKSFKKRLEKGSRNFLEVICQNNVEMKG